MERKIRVLMVAPRFPPYQGGVETHVHEVGRRLVADHGIAVHVVTTDLSGDLEPNDRFEGMRVTRVPAWPRGSDLYWSPPIAHAVRRSRADVVHVQGYHTLVPPLALFAARGGAKRTVLTFHSGGHSSPIRRLVRPAQLRGLRPLLRNVDRLIAVSAFEAELLRRQGIDADRLVIIPSGGDLPLGADAPEVPRDRALIVSIGRLERYKGHRRLVEALPRVRAAIPDVRLQIVGSGPDAESLQALAARLGIEGAVTVGPATRFEMPSIIRSAGVVALLSEYESQGLAAYEALALGAPLVITDATALAELKDRPGVVALEPSAGSDEVAAALLRQLRSPSPPESGPPLPTWDACAAAHAELYRSVIEARARSDRTPG